jgi:hypothetical protein
MRCDARPFGSMARLGRRVDARAGGIDLIYHPLYSGIHFAYEK